MPFTRAWAFKFGATALLFGVILALSLNRDFYTGSMVSAYLSLALASALIVLVMIQRSWFDLLWVVPGGLFLALLDFRGMGYQPMFMAGFSFLGLSALAVLGAHTIWAEGEERKLLLYGFLPAVLFVGSEWMATTLLEITETLHPKTFDLFLYSFDSSLHVQFSFLMGQLFWTWPWVRFACLVIYIALPLPLALVYAAHLRGKKENALAVMLAFLVTGPLGVLFYNMLPACGPVHVFGSAFPFHPLAAADAMRMAVAPILIKGPRNAIPSLHMTWVLLVWWNSRGLPRWIRAIAMIFVVLTAMATTGTGEHYFIDLVVAFPFSLMVQALCSYSLPIRSGERRNAFLFGTFTTLIWLALLSFSTGIFWSTPILPWAMVLATIAPSIYLWRRLLTAGSEPQPMKVRAAAATA
ncbi:MAG TPA: phosphatase PAP2 family protein [Candidatus Sulfotelmatobacter sp.]|nr:phosphatase PAP2 family protein [Candidatus Sulfotelmatobacter sp.]